MTAEATPRQNRVTPAGHIEATPHRGMFMGNRGRLGPDGWETRAWIVCSLHYRDQRVAERLYTPLFFHDEAVALSAGFRPCAQCRRDAFKRFSAAFAAAHGMSAVRAGEIDRRLRRRVAKLAKAPLHRLPAGTFVRLEGDGLPLLWWAGALWPWTHAGYLREPERTPREPVVEIITPPPTVRALAAGYIPSVSMDFEPGV